MTGNGLSDRERALFWAFIIDEARMQSENITNVQKFVRQRSN